ncbi:M10 family metallopeptidase C-terminal domain-containing protein [Limimaricola variabilis]
METTYSGPAANTQSEFSRSYTAFLDQYTDKVIEYLAAQKGIVITSRTWDLNQNSSTGTPFLVGVDPKYFEEFFTGTKSSFTWTSSAKKQTIEHTRYYFTQLNVPDPVPEPNPWGDNAFTIDGSLSATGVEGLAGPDGLNGGAGVGGDKGADGAGGAIGQNAVRPGSGSGGSKATIGGAGSDGKSGETGEQGENGQNGGDGEPGTAAYVIDPDTYGAILIDATGQSVSVIGGPGGDGGNGGAGGAGGAGGMGGNGGSGGAGGNGVVMPGNPGVGDARSEFTHGANGGTGGAAGSGGDGGPGAPGGDGGDGANAIVNGTVRKVYIIGEHDVTILGGAGGMGGMGGAGGDGGDGGTAGQPGTGGLGGARASNGTAGDRGATGSTASAGTAGEYGARGEDGLDGKTAAAFSDAVIVDATRFTGNLTISGSDYADEFKFGSGSSTVYATTGSDKYTLNNAGVETFIYTSMNQSNGADTDSFDSFNFTQDSLDLSALWREGSRHFWVGDSLFVDIDGGGADMEFVFSNAVNSPATDSWLLTA